MNTAYFTYQLRDTEKYLINMQSETRHPLRDEFLIELYKYQKNYSAALILAVDSYDYSYRKEELSTNILELANEINNPKAASFANLKKALLYIEKRDYDQAKSILREIPKKNCNSLCKNLKRFI
jgi:predicted negative regulator of RcsB-dependent stress response